MPRIFVSQQRMQQWTEDGRVQVENNIMMLPTMGRSFRLTGVGVADFSARDAPTSTAPQQLDLLTAPAAAPTATTAARNAALQAALSAIRGRHGDQALYPADAGHERNNATGASTHHPVTPRRR